MGQKVNPISFRILNGNNRVWNSNWFSKKRIDYVKNIVGDIKVYDYFRDNAIKYSVGNVNIERSHNGKIKIGLKTGKIGLVVGKNGNQIDKIESSLKKELSCNSISFDVKELRKAYFCADFVASSICDRIKNRQSFKRVVKMTMEQVMKAGAFGVKISCAGRLNGAEIARTEKFKDGIVPLHTLRADIDYAHKEAITTYGVIGVKVWICTRR